MIAAVLMLLPSLAWAQVVTRVIDGETINAEPRLKLPPGLGVAVVHLYA